MSNHLTINGIAAKKYGVQGCIVEFRNLESDYCELYVPGNSVPDDFAPGSTVSIELDGTRIFVGTSLITETQKTATSKQIKITIVGPFHLLNSTVLVGTQQTQVYSSSQNEWVPQTIETSTFHVSGTLAERVQFTLNFAARFSICRVGHIDLPSFSPPKDTLNDQTCGQYLRSLLSRLPGAILTFDYSTSPPTCHVLKQDSAHLSAVTCGSSSSFNFKDRTDLIIRGIRIDYERIINKTTQRKVGSTGNTISNSSTLRNPVSSDSAGQLTGPNVLRITRTLTGSQRIFEKEHQFDLVTPPLAFSNFSSSDDTIYIDFKKIGTVLHFTGVNCSYIENVPFPNTYLNNRYAPTFEFPVCKKYTAYLRQVGPNSGPSSSDKLFILRTCESRHDIPDIDLWLTAGFAIFTIRLITDWYESKFTNLTTRPPFQHDHTFYCANLNGQNPGGQIIRRTFDHTSDSLESAPSGLASEFLKERTKRYYDGSFTDRLQSTGPLDRIFTYGGRTMSVQSIRLDFGACIRTVVFGPPNALSPQDFIAMMANLSP